MAKTAAALHILVKEEKQAQEMLAQLEQGADFEKLAKKHSTCPSGKKGGYLGEFKQGAIVSIKGCSLARCSCLMVHCTPSSVTHHAWSV